MMRTSRFTAIAAIAAAAWSTGTIAQTPARATIYVTESGGIRRTAFPTYATVPFAAGELREEAQARLLLNDTEVPAQLSVASRWPDGSIKTAVVDFNASPGPTEQQIFQLEYGAGVKAAPVPCGLMVTETADAVQAGAIRVSKNGAPLLASVNYGGERIAMGANGLEITDASGAVLDLAAARSMKAEVLKRGPLVAAIRYAGEWPLAGGSRARFEATVEMPSSKSWARIAAVIEDPSKGVRRVAVRTPLAFASLPLTWDFGTEGWSYGALRAATDTVNYTASVDPRRGGQWTIKTASAGKDQIYATSVAKPSLLAGWGHVQDGRSVVAFAVEDFGRTGTSTVEIDGTGRLAFLLAPTTTSTTHRLTVYEHFVSTPVQIGAATSPAAILAPLHAGCDRERFTRSGVAIPADWTPPSKAR